MGRPEGKRMQRDGKMGRPEGKRMQRDRKARGKEDAEGKRMQRIIAVMGRPAGEETEDAHVHTTRGKEEADRWEGYFWRKLQRKSIH